MLPVGPRAEWYFCWSPELTPAQFDPHVSLWHAWKREWHIILSVAVADRFSILGSRSGPDVGHWKEDLHSLQQDLNGAVNMFSSQLPLRSKESVTGGLRHRAIGTVQNSEAQRHWLSVGEATRLRNDAKRNQALSCFWEDLSFLIVDLTFHGQWDYIVPVRCQPPCSGTFAFLGSHTGFIHLTGASEEVVLARCNTCSSKLCLLFSPFEPRSLQQTQLRKNDNCGTATS